MHPSRLASLPLGPLAGVSSGSCPGLLRACRVPLASDGPQAIVLAFDAVAFDPRAFAAHGIACPAAIARSVRKRQAEFFFGRYAARIGLSALAAPRVQIGIGAQREPVWPAGLIGSIAHGHGLAAAVVAPATSLEAVGIDLEACAQGEALAAIRQCALDDEEAALLCGLSQDPQDIARFATLVFSAKESFFKAAFPSVGRFFGFEAVKVCGLEPAQGRLVLRPVEGLGAAFPRGGRVPVGFAFVDPGTVMTWVCRR